MRTIIILLLIACVPGGMINAQAQEARFLRIGDVAPDLPLRIHKGGIISVKHMRDLREKLVILDFWGTACASCIADMPAMMDLQDRYKDKVQVLLVTTDRLTDIDLFWKRMKGHLSDRVMEAGRKLSFVTGDSAIGRLFPHDAMGVHVWIDGNGIYRTIAYAASTTIPNVEKFLTTGKAEWARYFISEFGPDELQSWTEDRIGFTDHLLRYAMVTRFDEKVFAPASLSVMVKKDLVTGRPIGLSCFNLSIPDLYRIAYFNSRNARRYRVLPEVAGAVARADAAVGAGVATDIDVGKYYPPRDDEKFYQWRGAHTYCYTSCVLPSGKNDVYAVMRKELDLFFNIASVLERRRVKVYALRRLDSTDRIRSQGGEGMTDVLMQGDTATLVIRNSPVRVLVDRLYGVCRNMEEGVDVVDETNYKGNVDLRIPWVNDVDRVSIAVLRASIRPYGLELVEEMPEADVLVLREQ